MRASTAFRRQILEGALKDGGVPRFEAIQVKAREGGARVAALQQTHAATDTIADTIQNAIAEIQPLINELDEIVKMLRENPRNA